MTPYDVSDDVIEVMRSPSPSPVAGAYRVFGETLRGLKTTFARILEGPVLPGPIWMLIKMGIFIFLSIWIRSTLPRVRYDRLMTIGWKVLLPAATINAIVTALLVVWV